MVLSVMLTQLPDGDMTIDSLSCQCPYGDAYDDYCKHLAAVLISMRERLDSDDITLEENLIIEDGMTTNPVIDSEALLQSLNMPALRGFIQQCLLRHPTMIDELIIWLSRYQQKAPDEDNSALRDSKVMQSMYRQIDAILDTDNRYFDGYDDDDYYYASESDFSDESAEFEHIYTQFEHQPKYQLACVFYWLGKLIAIYEEYPELDTGEGFYTGFSKLGQLVFGTDESDHGKIAYCPSWSDDLDLYQIDLDKGLLQELGSQGDEWQTIGTIDESGSSFQPARFGFDLLIAKQQWYVALALLNDHIENERFSKYGNHQLESLVTLKIALLAHLQNSDLAANKQIADAQINEVLSEFAYLPKIRGLLVDRAMDLGAIDIAISLLNKGMAIAHEKGQAGTVTKWKKRLIEIALHADDLPASIDPAFAEVDMTEIIRKNGRALAFDRGSNIDENYYKIWRDSYSSDEWQQVISAEQTRIKRLIDKDDPQSHHTFGSFNRHHSTIDLLAQIYSLEADNGALVELLKHYGNASLLKEYQAQIIDADATWLIDFYSLQWSRQIEQVGNRKAYNELAQDIQRMLNTLPAGADAWKPLVNEWQSRFSEYPRKPALLDELSKIHWPKPV